MLPYSEFADPNARSSAMSDESFFRDLLQRVWTREEQAVAGRPDTLRKQPAHALARVAQELAVTEVPHE
jgi:hypothetical protein